MRNGGPGGWASLPRVLNASPPRPRPPPRWRAPPPAQTPPPPRSRPSPRLPALPLAPILGGEGGGEGPGSKDEVRRQKDEEEAAGSARPTFILHPSAFILPAPAPHPALSPD